MLEAREYAAWDHTASLLTCITGLVKKGVKVQDFHPYRRRESRGKMSAKELKSMQGFLPQWRDPNVG